VTRQCDDLTNDLSKIFDIYWLLGNKKKMPDHLPKRDSTAYNQQTPMKVSMNGRDTEVYLSSSPPNFCASGRTQDLDALLSVVNSARKFLYLSVMDYAPMFLYSHNHEYWDLIDSALRRAVVSRGVQVRFLLGYWSHTRPDIVKYLDSLNQLRNMSGHKGDLNVRLFKVPITDPIQKTIPFARVDHAKFMVSESHAFIGTSNWSADYFVNTGGVSIVATCPANGLQDGDCIRDQLQAVFDRDWASQYAHHLNHTSANV
jgi:phospholipase D3/4